MRALDDGIRRFRDANAAQPMSKWPACRVLIATAAEQLAHRIREAADQVAEGRGVRGAAEWGPVFLYVDAEVLAVATICSLLDALTTHPEGVSTTAARNAIGQRVMMETHFTVLKLEAPRLKAVMERRIKRWDRRSLRRAMDRIEEGCAKTWPARKKQAIGHRLLMLAEGLGLIETAPMRLKAKRVKTVRLTDAATEVINKMNDHLELMAPVCKPMLTQPNDWAPGERGGYILLSRYHQLVKSSPGYPDEMPDDHGPMVYDGVNALQRTGWRINHTVLDTMERAWRMGGGVAGVPEAEDFIVPPRHEKDGDDTEWRIAAEQIHRRNARLVGKRLSFLQTVAIAKEYRRHVFYFPYQCDFRGRIYPIPQFLQPQGNDVARGLLTFAEPKPLGERGLWWLRVQYANCHGVDKVSFGERVAWTDEVLHDLIEQHHDMGEWDWPEWMDYRHLWADADDPWQALATLIEIGSAYSYGVPHEYPCSLPVNVDGSNSGLQHFSAMLRDPVGARLVNLTPCEQPSDIYSDVAVCVDRMVREDAGDPNRPPETPPHAEGWLAQGIDRKLCKRGTMTYCYGVTQQGLKDALVEDGFVDWADHQYAACQYIGKKIWAGIQECITGATEAMDWLRACATCANKAEVLLEWRTPSGFHVQHPYNEPKSCIIRCMADKVCFKVYDPEADVRPHKQRNALPPNFVHSLDASHLLMTVSGGTACGILHWMMIHDSFGTHACNVDLLRDVLREQFVRLYSIDVLDNFRQQVIEQTGYDPGPLPERGDFELETVHDSDYIFS